MYNTLSLKTVCPRCGTEVEAEADFRFGLRDLSVYRLGDRLRWEGDGVRTPETRPEDGNFDGEAYAVCPRCGRDFWLALSVRQDVIASAAVDTARPASMADELAERNEQTRSTVQAQPARTPGTTDPLVVVRRIPYEEPHQIRLEFAISNGVFNGSVDIYCSVRELKELGAALRKFPARIGDEHRYEYGSEDPEFQHYRYFVLRAYTVGSTGHCAIQFIINLNLDEPDEGECRCSIEAEAAAINRLGGLFEEFARLEHLEFRWSPGETALLEQYQLSDVPSTVVSAVRTPQYFPAPPGASPGTQGSWDPFAYAAKMRGSTADVSAFFLIDSRKAFSKCFQWLAHLRPYGMPDVEHSPYFDEVREIFRSNRQVMNFDYEFELVWKERAFPAMLRCHSVARRKYEIELWFPGVIANEVADTFGDGHEGFFCTFMPPAFYD